MSIKFGIMQGRLTKVHSNILQKFPKNWMKEFDYIKKTKLDYIEFFTENKKNKNNPIWSNNGLKNIKKKTSLLKYKRIILCDNFTISNSFTSKKNENYLKNLIDQLSFFKNSMLVIPIFSRKLKDFRNFNNHIFISSRLLDYAIKKNVNLSFELFTNLKVIKKFCQKLSDKKNFGITYDTGNAYLINKDFYKEISFLKKYVTHIHLKDRDEFGKNVKLGEGKIKFNYFLKKLNYRKKYKGSMTFETNRGDDPIETANTNLNIIKSFLV